MSPYKKLFFFQNELQEKFTLLLYFPVLNMVLKYL